MRECDIYICFDCGAVKNSITDSQLVDFRRIICTRNDKSVRKYYNRIVTSKKYSFPCEGCMVRGNSYGSRFLAQCVHSISGSNTGTYLAPHDHDMCLCLHTHLFDYMMNETEEYTWVFVRICRGDWAHQTLINSINEYQVRTSDTFIQLLFNSVRVYKYDVH